MTTPFTWVLVVGEMVYFVLTEKLDRFDSLSRYVGSMGEHVFKDDNALKKYRSLTHCTCIQNAASSYPTKCHVNLYDFSAYLK